MPTVFGMIVLGLLVVGTIAGLVLWGRSAVRDRKRDARIRSGSEVPYDENRAAAEQARTVDRQGWV